MDDERLQQINAILEAIVEERAEAYAHWKKAYEKESERHTDTIIEMLDDNKRTFWIGLFWGFLCGVASGAVALHFALLAL